MSHFSKWTLSPHWYLYFSVLLFGCGCWCPIEEGGQCGFGECDYGSGSEYEGQRTGQQWEKHLGHALGTRNIKARWEKWERKSDEKFHTIKKKFFFLQENSDSNKGKDFAQPVENLTLSGTWKRPSFWLLLVSHKRRRFLGRSRCFCNWDWCLVPSGNSFASWRMGVGKDYRKISCLCAGVALREGVT